MKATRTTVVSFLAGAAFAGALVYTLKPQRAAVGESDLLLLNKKMTESSFPELRTAKFHAYQAMDLFEHRKDEEKIALICSRAISDYLSVIERTLEKGDMDFMADAIQQDRERVVRFLAVHPQLKP